jgi:deoxyribodipyrimidine photo-lyase
VPELKDLPNKYLFNPWLAPENILHKANVHLGTNYPKPIIDIDISRKKAMAAYELISKDNINLFK